MFLFIIIVCVGIPLLLILVSKINKTISEKVSEKYSQKSSDKAHSPLHSMQRTDFSGKWSTSNSSGYKWRRQNQGIRYYYYTIKSNKKSQVAYKYIREFKTYSIIKNEFDDDDTLNIYTSENSNNITECCFLDYLGDVGSLSIYGVPAYTILEVFKSDTPHQVYFDQKKCTTEQIELCINIFNKIKEKHGFSDEETINYIKYNYCLDLRTQLDDKDVFSEQYRLHQQEWKGLYNRVYQRLIIEDGYKTKWVNEESLFRLIVKHYPDAIYQYRPKYLGLQSLDIYIPSKKVAIEYQGVQHYKPVEFFGGEEAFAKRKELDNRKKELCKDNGVRLIEWKYDETISLPILEKKLNQAE